MGNRSGNAAGNRPPPAKLDGGTDTVADTAVVGEADPSPPTT
jgi:hypothetical protein